MANKEKPKKKKKNGNRRAVFTRNLFIEKQHPFPETSGGFSEILHTTTFATRIIAGFFVVVLFTYSMIGEIIKAF